MEKYYLLIFIFSLFISPVDTKIASEGKSVMSLDINHIAGYSPKVFDKGWVFGANCILNENGQDNSDKVRWSGSGKFYPETGAVTYPVFNSTGENYIVMECEFNGTKISKRINVSVVSSDEYACVGNISYCSADSHGCPGCPHSVDGPIIQGSLTVMVRDQPAARKGDWGKHAVCCGPQQYQIIDGDPEVLIDGKPAAKIGGPTKHCGGYGTISSDMASGY